MEQFVIYHNPDRQPHPYVVSRFIIDKASVYQDRGFHGEAVDLDSARAVVKQKNPNLVMVTRSPEDAADIVEVWI